MPRYIEFNTEDGGSVLVEVEEKEITRQSGIQKAGVQEALQGAVAQAKTTIDAALRAVVQYNANAFIKSLSEMIQAPDEVEMTFGLKATGEAGNLAIAKIAAEASYSIKLKWNAKNDKPP